VEPQPHNVKVYFTADGKAPFEQWISGLRDGKGRGIIRNRIDRVETGNFGGCEPVGEGVFELKIDFGPGYQVYFGMDGADVILLWGGDKSTQQADIQKAKEHWGHYHAEED
jgi:putative addiction module killer protein